MFSVLSHMAIVIGQKKKKKSAHEQSEIFKVHSESLQLNLFIIISIKHLSISVPQAKPVSSTPGSASHTTPLSALTSHPSSLASSLSSSGMPSTGMSSSGMPSSSGGLHSQMGLSSSHPSQSLGSRQVWTKLGKKNMYFLWNQPKYSKVQFLSKFTNFLKWPTFPRKELHIPHFYPPSMIPLSCWRFEKNLNSRVWTKIEWLF